MKPTKLSFLFYSLSLFLGVYVDISLPYWVIAGMSLLFFFFLFRLGGPKAFYKARQRTSIKDIVVLSTIFFLLGSSFKTFVQYKNTVTVGTVSPHIERDIAEPIEVKILEVTRAKESKRFIGQLIRVGDTLSGSKVLIYFSEAQPKLYEGDIIRYIGQIKPISAPRNIGQFDYQKYMSGKEVFLQTYVQAYVAVGKDRYWRYQLLAARRMLIDYIYAQPTGLSEQAKALVVALILGERSFIDPEVVGQFKAVGVMHILAISGLHIGLLYLIFWRCLFFIPKPRRGIGVLLLLWTFVFLSGFSASVFRAVLMCTVIAMSEWVRRDQDIEHSIGFALFTSLCIYPNWVYDIGFQFSYLAVLSIIYIYPLFKWYYIRSRVLRYMRGIIYISLSVQIGLIPFQLYYFGQFSFLFLVANLVVIPIVTVVVVLGVAYVVTMWIPVLSVGIGYVLTAVVAVMYILIDGVNYLDFLIFEEVSLSGSMTLIAVLLTVGFIISRYRRKYIYLRTACVISVGIQLTTLGWGDNDRSHSSFSVIVPYVAKQREAVVWVRETDTLHIYKRKVDTMGVSEQYALNNYTSKYTEVDTVIHPLRNMMLLDAQRLLWVVDRELEGYKAIEDVAVVMLVGQSKVNVERLLEYTTPEQVVIHSSVPFWLKKKYIAYCVKKDFPTYDIAERGYWSYLAK